MIATAFDEDNAVLGPPVGVGEGEVHSLSVFRGIAADGSPVVISCWKSTKKEIDEINRTGRVWLMVYGYTMPSVVVEGVSPFNPRGG